MIIAVQEFCIRYEYFAIGIKSAPNKNIQTNTGVLSFCFSYIIYGAILVFSVLFV